jgi:hypothetical protein
MRALPESSAGEPRTRHDVILGEDGHLFRPGLDAHTLNVSMLPTSTASATTTHPWAALAVNWFPAEEFTKVLRKWPELA